MLCSFAHAFLPTLNLVMFSGGRKSPKGSSLVIAVFQRSRIRSKKSGAGASRIRSRSCYRIQDLLIPHFIGSFCFTGAPVKPISSVLQDLLSIKTCSKRSTCEKRSTCNSRSNTNTRSFCNNRNAELSCFSF